MSKRRATVHRFSITLPRELAVKLSDAAIQQSKPFKRMTVSRLIRQYVERGLREDGHG